MLQRLTSVGGQVDVVDPNLVGRLDSESITCFRENFGYLDVPDNHVLGIDNLKTRWKHISEARIARRTRIPTPTRADDRRQDQGPVTLRKLWRLTGPGFANNRSVGSGAHNDVPGDGAGNQNDFLRVAKYGRSDCLARQRSHS